MTDTEYLNKITIIEIYCEILLGILSYVPVQKFSSEKEYRKILNKNLKFDGEYNDRTLRACIDLIEDNQLAINEIEKNGLETKSENKGEIYLRLYGILNAGYLQYQAIKELIELFKIPNKKEIDKEFKKLKFIELRNKLGSHTPKWADSTNENKSKTKSFRIVRTELSKWGNDIVIVSNYGEVEKYNLLPELKYFNRFCESYLDIIIEKALKSIFPNESKNKKWMTDRLEIARIRRKNCVEQRV